MLIKINVFLFHTFSEDIKKIFIFLTFGSSFFILMDSYQLLDVGKLFNTCLLSYTK